MAVTRHPNGYLQIDRFEDIQVIAPPGQSVLYPNGSILWRLFKSWNERRHAIGMSIFAYKDDQFIQVETIQQATIYQGANLQNYKFWRRLQELAFEKVLDNGNDSDYINSIIYGNPEASGLRTKDATYHPLPDGIESGNYDNIYFPDVFGDGYGDEIIRPATTLDRKVFYHHIESNNFSTSKSAAYDSLGLVYRRYTDDIAVVKYGYIQPRDIIGVHIVNDLLMVYSRVLNIRPWFQVYPNGQLWQSFVYGSVEDSLDAICEASYNGINPFSQSTSGQSYYSDFANNFGSLEYDYFYVENGITNFVSWYYTWDHLINSSAQLSKISQYNPQRANAIFATTAVVFAGGSVGYINTLGISKNSTKSFSLVSGQEYDPSIPSSFALKYEDYFPSKRGSESPPKEYVGKNCSNVERGTSYYSDYMFLQIICRFSDLPKQGDPL